MPGSDALAELTLGYSPVAFLAIALGGFLAALLPCVYPLYPITARIISSRGESRLHPLVYYAGIVTMYAVFGLIAGLTGGAFNSLMRLPETNLVIAVILVTLAFVSLGLLPGNWFKGREFGKSHSGFTGTYLMGMAAGMLSSPCVGPVVISVLLQIISESGTGLQSGLLASVKMSLFGAGVGIPFLAIGLFGLRLPRSGNWMRLVQFLLGVAILWFAWSYWTKAAAGLGLSLFAMPVRLLLSGVILYIILGLFRYPTPHTHRFAIAFLSALLLGVWQSERPVASIATAAENTIQTGNLTWYRERAAAYSQAEKSYKPVFIDFYADWCANCKEFEELAAKPGRLNQILQSAVLLRIHDTDPDFETYQNDSRFPELQIGLPFFVVTDYDGNLFFKTTDYQATEAMASGIKQAGGRPE